MDLKKVYELFGNEDFLLDKDETEEKIYFYIKNEEILYYFGFFGGPEDYQSMLDDDDDYEYHIELIYNKKYDCFHIIMYDEHSSIIYKFRESKCAMALKNIFKFNKKIENLEVE